MKGFSTLFLASTFILASCGGGGGGGGGSPTPSEPSPTSSLSASSSSVLIDTVVTLTWSSTNATSCTASGTWTGTKSTSGSEDVTISTPGNNQFTITCSGAGGSQAASVTVEGYRNTEGVTVDGYIRQADIFIDTNDSYTADSGEDTTTSDNDGKFTIKYSNGNLISLGGTDLDSGNALDNLLIVHKLTGHSNFKAVTPVTSVAAFMADPSLVNAALGIDASLDIATVDPVAGKGDSGINDYLYEKGNQLTVLAYALQNITNNLNTTTDTTQDYFKAIAEELDTEYSATETRVNIETEAFITKVIDNIIAAKTLTVAEENRSNLITALASVMPVIEVKSSDTLTTAVFDFATSTLQTDAQAMANGTAAAETITSYQTDILNYVATDQNVDPDEITPTPQAIVDKVTLDEDTAIDIDALANDSYVTTAPISIKIQDEPIYGIANIINNNIRYEPDNNFNGSDVFNYIITQGNSYSMAAVDIIINPINDAPTFNNLLSTYSVPENETGVTNITGDDVDGDTLSLSLGGTDATAFNLSSENNLNFNEPPDYETKNTYQITLSVADESETTSKDITILVTQVNESPPIFTSSSTFSLDENTPGAWGGFVEATDADGDTITYSISGSDITIDAASGGLAFVSPPDYEMQSSYSAVVTATDGTFFTNQNIIISIININDNAPELPYDPSASLYYPFIINENQNYVGSMLATDADGDQISYSLANYNGTEDAALMSIDEVGNISLNSAADYEERTGYWVEVIASDGERQDSQGVAIEISNTNDNYPVFTSPDNFQPFENQTAIGTVIATDADGDNISYYITGDNSEISIDSTGFLSFVKAPDYESKSIYNIVVSADDGFYVTNQNITINVSNVNEPPVVVSRNFYVDENQLGIGTFVASDPDGDRITYSIYGFCEDYININASTGLMSFITTPDYENNSYYSCGITLTTFDAFSDTPNYVQTGPLNIYINNLNDNSPIFTNNTSIYNVVENFGTSDSNRQYIGDEDASDLDGDTINYSISGSEIKIDPESGEMYFAEIVDYESKSSYSATVSASDNINTTSRNITILISNINDNSPVIENEISFNAYEDQEFVGFVNASDADGDTITYSTNLEESNFTIDSPTGLISKNPDQKCPDNNDANPCIQFGAQVFVSDGESTSQGNVTIWLYKSQSNNNPVITSDSTFSANENQTSIGTVTADDIEGDTIAFSISGSEINIDSSTGVMTFASAPDYETKSSYTATVSASDEYGVSNQNISVTINNVNEAPSITSSATFNVDENQTSIGTVTATDADGDTITFSISGSEINIDSSTGVMTFASAPDYETKSSYTATVSVTDGANIVEGNLQIIINNVNEAPSITSSATFNVDENQTSIGTVTATDVDGDTIAFSISGSEINIDSSTGVMTFASAPDYETKSIYTEIVTVFDGVNTATQNIIIKVNNLNDSTIVITSSSNFNADENQTSIGTVTATDADGDTITFSISGSEINIDSSTGVMTFVTAPDYETKSSYTATVSATDGINSTPQNITITVRNLNDNNPAFTSDANFNADENQINIGTVTATDADGDNVTFSISGSEINIDSSTGVMTFVTAPDYETKSTYTAIVTAVDGVYYKNQNITVSINNQNEGGVTITSDANFNADENQTSIGTVTATDADGDTIAFSISSSEINIDSSTGVMTFASAPDYETKSSYTATVSATGSNSVTQNITISINNLNDNSPKIITTEMNINENNLIIGTIIATDLDGDNLTYNLLNNPQEFILDRNTGELSFTDISYSDYEFRNAYPIQISVNDNQNTVYGDITINILNINEGGVTITSDANFNADENQTSIGTVTATDADGDNVTFSISGSEINIDSSTGVMTFVTAPDYETKSSYTATVSATGSNSVTQNITVNITNVNEAPSITSSATFNVDENQTSIGTVTATDADGDTIAFSISGSEINIDSSTGVMTFASAPDYETKSSYTATVSVTDGANIVEGNLQIIINNVNEAPSITSSATFNVDENQTSIGTVTATDADGDTITFSISGSEINIDSSTGVMTFASAPDYETKSSYTATVSVTDGANITSQNITITINNVNEGGVTITSDANFNADENQTSIGTVTATDADGDNVTFSISGSEINIDSSTGVMTFASAPDYETKSSYTATVSATGSNSVTQNITISINNKNDNNPAFTSDANFNADENQTSIGTVTATDADGDTITFSISGSEINIDSSTGVMTFASAPDYETKSSYTAIVTASDSFNSNTQSITVNIADVNEAPSITSSATFNVDENQLNAGTVTATDADGDTITFSISGSEINIDSSTGVMTFASAPDYETKSSYTTTVSVTDGANITSQNITITINNVNEAPVITSGSTDFRPFENQLNAGTVTATDVDGDTITFSISGSEINIDSSTGVMTFASAPDYETKSIYTATVSATDGINSTPQNITITVRNLNDNDPVITSSLNFSANENQINIGTVTATDADGDNVTFSISGTDAGAMTINSTNGVLTFNSAPDYETKSSYTATVAAYDGTNSTTQNITITIIDINEAPTFTSSTNFSANENQTSIGNVSASDVDGDGITFAISGSEIIIDSSTGVLTFASAPDYETKSSYTATVTASDGTNSTTQNITVSIKNLNDNGPIMTLQGTYSAEENQTSIGTLTAADADGDSVTFSITGSELQITTSNTMFNNFGVLTFASAPDYETKSSYTATVTASDGTYSQSSIITVNVTDVNEAPAFTSSATFSANENQTSIGNVSASDVDGDTIAFSISGSDINIDSSTGVMTFAIAPDYETKSSYTATVTANDGTNSTTQGITVTINNLNDNTPSITSSATFSMTENTTAIGSVIASDADGDSVTFSISGTDAGAMTINSTNGVLTFNSAPDYETKSSYSVIATATDGINSNNQNVTIDVVDDVMLVASQDNTNDSTGSDEWTDGPINIDFAENVGGTKDTYTIAFGDPYFDEWLSGEGRYQENVGRAYGYRYDNSINHSSMFYEDNNGGEWGSYRGSDVAVADSGDGKMLTVVGIPNRPWSNTDVTLHLTIDDGSVNGSTCSFSLDDIDGLPAKLYMDYSGMYVDISGDGRTIAISDEQNGNGLLHTLYNTNADPYSCSAIDPSIDSNWTILPTLEGNAYRYYHKGGAYGFKLSHDGMKILSLGIDADGANLTVFKRNPFNSIQNYWIRFYPLTNAKTVNVWGLQFQYAGRDTFDMSIDGTVFAAGSTDGAVHYGRWNSAEECIGSTCYITASPSILSFMTNKAEHRSDINTRTRSIVTAVELNQDGSIIAIARDSGCVDIVKNVGDVNDGSTFDLKFYGEICSQVNATSINNIEFNSDMTRIHWTGFNANGHIYERFYLTEVNN